MGPNDAWPACLTTTGPDPATCLFGRSQILPEPSPGSHPVALRSAQGHTHRLGCFGFVETGEVSTFDDLSQALVATPQALEGPIEIQQLLRVVIDPHFVLVERDRLGPTTTFCSRLGTSELNHDLSHCTRRDREEVPPIFQVQSFLLRHLEIRLMNERRGVEGRAATASDLAASYPAKLVVDHRHESVERAPIPVAHGVQQLRDLASRLFHDVPTHSVYVAVLSALLCSIRIWYRSRRRHHVGSLARLTLVRNQAQDLIPQLASSTPSDERRLTSRGRDDVLSSEGSTDS